MYADFVGTTRAARKNLNKTTKPRIPQTASTKNSIISSRPVVAFRVVLHQSVVFAVVIQGLLFVVCLKHWKLLYSSLQKMPWYLLWNLAPRSHLIFEQSFQIHSRIVR